MDGVERQSPSVPVKSEVEDDLYDLNERLSRLPGREYIDHRPGPGGKKIPYLSGEKSTSLANEIFGTSGWSCSVLKVEVDEMEVTSSVIRVLVTATVKVTSLYPNKHGYLASHEDIGTGFAQMNLKSHNEIGKQKHQVMDTAKKSAVTNARKRAVCQFGNALGLFLKDDCAVKAAMRESMESQPPYSVHHKGMSVSRMGTPALSTFGSSAGYLDDRSTHKRKAVESRMEVDEKARLMQLVESEDWDTFE